MRRWFYMVSALLLLGVAALAQSRPGAWLLLLVLGPLIALGVYHTLQTRHTLLRNFPLLALGRYLMEMVRPEIQQYFIESNTDAFPIEREMRSVVYQRAKGELETQPFGTVRDVYRAGYEWASHSIAPRPPMEQAPRVRIGGPQCRQPYDASLLNVSAMSFGALSSNAILALNGGAKLGGFAHNTGEGGISRYHREPGGDLIWQIGTGYFGCRDKRGRFDPVQFGERAVHEQVKMIEIKLSQGAKPGHGGVLPGAKVTAEIAAARGVPQCETVFSPPAHSAFSTPVALLEFVAQLRELSGGKPIGIKFCVGRRTEVFCLLKAVHATGIVPDFMTIDGGEGGTGAAPLEFANSLGMPARDAWVFVHNALVGAGVRDQIKVIASGKIITGFHMVRALALGADVCNSARAMMLALGCIQALRCNSNHCPTGIATQNPSLVKGLHVGDKTQRVARFHKSTIHSFLELLGAMGLEHPSQLRPHHIYRRGGDLRVHHYDELYESLEPGQLLAPDGPPSAWRREWAVAGPDSWVPCTFAEAGG